MRFADKLVLNRQRHLKWRAFDVLELVLMMLCGVLLFGFSTTVTLRYRHPQHRSSVAVAPGSHVDVLHLRDFHRRSRRHAPQRSPLSDGAFRSDARHAAARDRDRHSPRGAGRRRLPGLFRLHQFSSRLRQLSHALDDANRLALCGDPDLRSADCAVHHRAARQRNPERIRPSRAARRAGSHHADRPPARRRSSCERSAYFRVDDCAVPGLRVYGRAGRLLADGRRAGRRHVHRRVDAGDHPKDVRRDG